MKYTIVVDKQSRTNPSDERKEITFEIDELRKKGDVHDDLVIEKGQAKVIRRIALSKYNVTSVLENEVIEELGEAKIPLFEGDNYIYVKDEYNNQMCAEYIVKSDFTDMYVTNLKMETAIEESVKQIRLFVGQTFATQEELIEERSERIQTATEISEKVEKKVDKNTITGAYLILKINNDESEAKLNADKITLTANDILNLIAGNEINLKSRDMTIASDCLEIDKNGRMVLKGDETVANIKIILTSDQGRNMLINPAKLVFTNETEGHELFLYNAFNGAWVQLNSGNSRIAMVNDGNEFVQIYLKKGNTETVIKPSEITTPKLTQTSTKSKKKNITQLKANALDLIKNSDICLYNLKGEKAGSKKHIGLVIGEGYNCPDEVISEDGQGIEQYSMTSVAWKAIQEQQKIIENLKQRVEKLEAK